MAMARTQTLVQLSETLLSVLDERAAKRGISRSQLIREAIEAHLADDVEAEISRQIVEGYTRVPDDGEFDAWALASAREMIAEEPW
jgi:metal-responsive CopG/Arc/MetJ family transcriptional regulator